MNNLFKDSVPSAQETHSVWFVKTASYFCMRE